MVTEKAESMKRQPHVQPERDGLVQRLCPGTFNWRKPNTPHASFKPRDGKYHRIHDYVRRDANRTAGARTSPLERLLVIRQHNLVERQKRIA